MFRPAQTPGLSDPPPIAETSCSTAEASVRWPLIQDYLSPIWSCAMAEERSYICAVTIITGDPDDIKLLVNLTHRTNIAVDVPA